MKKPKLYKKFNRDFLDFYDWACEYLEKHNKKLTVKGGKYLRTGDGNCAGWCDGDEIVIAGKTRLFEETFVHEFCHMQQVIEGSPLWIDSEYDIWEVIKKKAVGIKDWDRFYESILVERDCELRAIKMSKKWNLFNNELYAQKANVYLYYYQYLFISCNWVNSTTIYKRKLVSLMPKKILPASRLKNIDMEMMKNFDKYLT
ncbi:hypothetical protein N9955_00075 [bacterium]|nr:hypothetical protein [bacterium]